jgi:hypothetical protein
MGAPLAETTVINRAKVKVLGDVLKLHDEIDKIKQAVEEQQPNQVNSIQILCQMNLKSVVFLLVYLGKKITEAIKYLAVSSIIVLKVLFPMR